jgi:predicted lipid-binding transport protein (Tim44 family)
MMNSLRLLMLVSALALVAPDADAARRFGGGNNLGKQRATPTQTAPSATPATPAKSAAPAPASTPTPAAPAPKPSFMSRWGGLLAGLGIGALLASMFGAQMGPMVGMLLAFLLLGAVVMLALRFFAARKASAVTPEPRMQYAGIGSAIAPEPSAETGGVLPSTATTASPPEPVTPGALSPAEVEPFLRVAKTSFIRLQAANDAGDLDDIRDYTTPEVFAEIAMQVKERGPEPQKTEVVVLDAKLVEDVVENDYAIASVRFSGLIRENDAAHPEPFEEIWHVRKNLRERNASWVISGIQQAA